MDHKFSPYKQPETTTRQDFLVRQYTNNAMPSMMFKGEIEQLYSHCTGNESITSSPMGEG